MPTKFTVKGRVQPGDTDKARVPSVGSPTSLAPPSSTPGFGLLASPFFPDGQIAVPGRTPSSCGGLRAGCFRYFGARSSAGWVLRGTGASVSGRRYGGRTTVGFLAAGDWFLLRAADQRGRRHRQRAGRLSAGPGAAERRPAAWSWQRLRQVSARSADPGNLARCAGAVGGSPFDERRGGRHLAVRSTPRPGLSNSLQPAWTYVAFLRSRLRPYRPRRRAGKRHGCNRCPERPCQGWFI